MKPTISILASAARPDLWIDWYKSIGENQVPFEVIFVGPNKPGFQLPDNFYFIESHVKPVQCWEIATRNASGECLIHIGDDMFFEFPNSLDTLYKDFLSYNTEKLMLSLQLKQAFTKVGTKVEMLIHGRHSHYTGGSFSDKVIMPTGFIMSNNYYRYLGGVDRNFISIYFEVDLCLRVIEDGGLTELSDVCTVEQIFRCNTKSLYTAYEYADREITLKRLWPMFNIHAKFKRSTILEPFSDYKILTESQGPKGQWV